MLAARLLHFFLLTLAVTAIVSPLAVWRYGASVLAGMRRASGAPLPVPPAARLAAGTTPAATPGDRVAARLAWERQAHRRAAWCWIASFVLAAVPMSIGYMLSAELPRTPLHALLIAAVMAVVAVPPLALSLGWVWWQGALRALIVLAGGAVFVVGLGMLQGLTAGRAPSAGHLLNAVQFAGLAAVLLSGPALLLAASGWARVRAIVPSVFGGLIVFASAPFLAGELWDAIAATEAGSRAVLDWESGVQTRHVLFALLALPAAALLGWRLAALARGYEAKRFSDVQLLARAWWLMVASLAALEVLNSHAKPVAGVIGCALSALLLGPLQRLVFTRAGIVRAAPPPRTLLLLRVFGFRARTERLFDRVGARWRWHGPVTMIAAPDVAARTIDAVDFLHWLLGRIDDTFVRNGSEVAARLAGSDTVRDPDGRFRVNELCCADDTWCASVVELMQRADAVLMDLRGMSRERKGCEFEIEQLGARVDPARIVLVVEPGADRSALASLLGAAADGVTWHELPERRRAPTAALGNALLAAAER